jgi:hypothetical protein
VKKVQETYHGKCGGSDGSEELQEGGNGDTENLSRPNPVGQPHGPGLSSPFPCGSVASFKNIASGGPTFNLTHILLRRLHVGDRASARYQGPCVIIYIYISLDLYGPKLS